MNPMHWRVLRWLVLLVIVAGGLVTAYHLRPGTPWYPKCVFFMATGLYCPGCGAGRALHALLYGQWLVAFRMNPLFFVLVPILLGCILAALVRDIRGKALPTHRIPASLYWVLVALVIVFSILRNLPGMDILRPL